VRRPNSTDRKADRSKKVPRKKKRKHSRQTGRVQKSAAEHKNGLLSKHSY
jgi:hypothetical protein